MGSLVRTDSEHLRPAPAQTAAPSADDDGGRSVASELVCGAVGGTISAMCVHPIDTVKTRMQAGHSSFAEGPMHTSVAAMLRREGIASFYRGIAIPLVSQPAYIGGTLAGMQFGRYLWACGRSQPREAEAKESLPAFCFAGATSGVFAAAAVTPGERLKVLMQASDAAKPRGLVEATRHVLRGGLPSVYRGLHLTVGREIPGNILWFFAYESAHDRLQDAGASRTQSVMGGATAAGVSWSLASTPFDRIKVMQQASEGTAPGVRALAARIWRTQGARGFMVGLVPTLGRNIPIDIIQFIIADKVRERFFGSR